MNEKINTNVKCLRPFSKMLITIGQLPTNYLMSMSYYEQILWFCKYLKDTVIPAINNNGEAVQELQQLFIELQEYVNHYFDNLDVQEEINNKLDEMAESGVLEEIIEQYLQTSALLGFNNIEEMKESINLIDGSFARVLGYNELNDGFQVTYKIRERLFEDEIDNDNIVLLNSGLIAQKIKNYSVQTIEDFVLYAFFDDINDDEIKLYISKDNLHLEELKLPNKIYGRDPSIIYFNNTFYIAITSYNTEHDFSIYSSVDLKTWNRHDINVGLYDSNFPNRWAPELFIDNNTLYVFISKQYTAPDSINVYGKFKTYKIKCNDIENLTFNSPVELNLTGNINDNFIDATCIKIDNTYHLILKCDSQEVLNLEHFISTDLLNFSYVSNDFGQFGRFAEGQFIYEFNGEYVIGAERYYERNNKESIYRIKTTNDLINFSNYKTMFVKNVDISHGSAIVIKDNKAKNLLFNLKNFGFKYNNDFIINNKNNYVIASNTQNYDFPKGTYLKIMSIFPRIPFKMFSILFKLTDTQGQNFDSLIQAEGLVNSIEQISLTEQNLSQISGKIRYNTNFKKANLHGKLIMVPNNTNKCYDIYLDLSDYNSDMTIILDIISTNIFDEDIQIYSEVFTNSLPVTLATINSAYACKNLFAPFNNLYIDNGSNNKLTLKLCMPNGSFELKGHGSNVQNNETYNYLINTLNGTINVINLNEELTVPLTFNVDSYNKGIYTISITGLRNASGFNIKLPDIYGSSILDYTLSSI